LYFF
jgi:hypothetical protein